ncbi:MAG: hypothetical protein U9Q85_00140 [Patescibacteria group bacterium]|nr:hypothetical protein [Patescibacteria group bacterium]
MSRKKKLQFQLSLAFILLISILVSGFFIFSPISVRQVVNAVTTNNYDAVTDGDPLNATDWNLLDNDFVHQDTGTANNLTVNNITINGSCSGAGCGGGGSVIENTSGTQLKMVCGSTPYLNSPWYDPPLAQHLLDNRVLLDVVVPVGTFSSDDVSYFLTLAGDGYLLDTKGFGSVYRADRNGFTAKVQYTGSFSSFNADQARAVNWRWHIRWCGVGQ